MTISQLINIKPSRSIGGIVAQATIEEVQTDELTITNHPVELGAAISDHAYLRPAEVVLRVGWSNSGVGAVVSAVQSISGASEGDNYVRGIYEKLRELQGKREPFDLLTGKRAYRNMLIAALAVTTDVRSENALICTVTCRQVIIAKTVATKMPERANQKEPNKTMQAFTQGVKQAFGGASPSPTGALKPSQWGIF